MSQEEIFINGELLRLSREARGWVINDMATRACMSVKQIRQLEEGGMSAFYSAAVKATSAKKVGGLLGLSADQVFSHTETPVAIEEAIEPEALIDQADVESVQLESAEPAVAKTEHSVKPVVEAAAQAPVATTAEPDVVHQSTPDDAPNSKNSLWMIAVLLAVALALGAYFQPQDEPVAAEPVPPIQVLPTDAVDPASAASAADSVASSAEVAVIQASAPAAVMPQKPASAVSAIVAPAVSPVASVARVVAPVASAATSAALRASSPVAVSTPAAASAAVKAP
jgi:transcriptional regulator with XRE-family HTH domain